MRFRICSFVLCLLILVALPLPAFAASSMKKSAPIEAEASKMESVGAGWLRKIFPKLRSVETIQARFVFDSAPETETTRAVLNKKGESITIYRFSTVEDLEKCAAMIQGSSVVYAGKTAYPGSEFPATYYYNAEENLITLYCGADAAVSKTIQKKGGAITGGFGGYFDERDVTIYGRYDKAVVLGFGADGSSAPRDLKDLRQAADSVYIVTVKQVPERADSDSQYELKVTKTIRGTENSRIRLNEWPDIMRLGRSYVLFIKHVVMENGSTGIQLADGFNKSAFEIDDKNNVLPIREYGMTASVKLDTFLKSV